MLPVYTLEGLPLLNVWVRLSTSGTVLLNELSLIHLGCKCERHTHTHKHTHTCSKMGAVLGELWLDTNDFEGDLSVLGPTRLAYVTVNDNPRLCGMVPASVRYVSSPVIFDGKVYVQVYLCRFLRVGQTSMHNLLSVFTGTKQHPLRVGQTSLHNPLSVFTGTKQHPLRVGQTSMHNPLSVLTGTKQHPLRVGQTSMHNPLSVFTGTKQHPLRVGQTSMHNPLSVFTGTKQHPLRVGQTSMHNPLSVFTGTKQHPVSCTTSGVGTRIQPSRDPARSTLLSSLGLLMLLVRGKESQPNEIEIQAGRVYFIAVYLLCMLTTWIIEDNSL